MRWFLRGAMCLLLFFRSWLIIVLCFNPGLDFLVNVLLNVSASIHVQGSAREILQEKSRRDAQKDLS